MTNIPWSKEDLLVGASEALRVQFENRKGHCTNLANGRMEIMFSNQVLIVKTK